HTAVTDSPSGSSTNYVPTFNNFSPGGALVIGRGVVVNLGDGGSFNFDGTSATIDGSILAPGGRIALSAMTPRAEGGIPGPELSIHLGSTAVLDAAGRLTNDALDGATGPLGALNGGSISLEASNILLEQGSLLDVSGGARISASGTRLSAGSGGSISI